MSAGTNRPSCHKYQTYQTCQNDRCQTSRCQTSLSQTYQLRHNAAAISAAARVDARCGPRPSLGLQLFILAALGCRSIERGGVETRGIWTR